MNLRLPVSFCFLVIVAQTTSAQKLKKADKATMAHLEEEIHYLADDKLEGRRTGTNGEKLASDFIVASFQKSGLAPAGDDQGWLQAFPVDDGKQIGQGTQFSVNSRELELGKDYFPLPYSGAATVNGSPAIALQESGSPWFIDLKEILESRQGNPHFDLEDAVYSKAVDCGKKGATAVIFYNSSRIEDEQRFDPKNKQVVLTVPVVYITSDGKKKYFKDESASLEIHLSVEITEKMRTGHNVIGLIDNGAPGTIIIGAHYDHLGYGEDGNSLYRGTEKQIHNGADDNASGTAALMEVARLLKQSKNKAANYLFIAFSGEELGLFGSKYFTEHPTTDLSKVNYMINMDMVGRLNDSSRTITLGGYGTSPYWGELFATKSKNDYFALKFDSSGTGPSDHTSFYRKDIPVLFFFTGLHSDYHRPTDDYDKINYRGELEIVKYITALAEKTAEKGKLAFTKTRETQSSTSARFSVTLGIMPDYTYSGSGVRVDGISDGKPAQKAGLKQGDIIVKLGDYPVSSLESYMQALSKFKKGDATNVECKRGDAVTSFAVRF